MIQNSQADDSATLSKDKKTPKKTPKKGSLSGNKKTIQNPENNSASSGKSARKARKGKIVTDLEKYTKDDQSDKMVN